MPDTHTQQVKNLYKNWAPQYDASSEKGVPYLIEEDIFIKAVNPKVNDIILDIGCGTGRNIEQLLKYTQNVEGTDLSEEMLNVAREKFPNINFFQADIQEAIPVADSKYTKITCSLTFQFLQNINKPLTEFHRILKPGGKAFITDFVSDAPIDWSLIKYKEEKSFKGSVGGVSVFRNTQEYKTAFAEAGFTIIKSTPLKIRENVKHILTEDSYANVLGNWSILLFEIQKDSL